MMYSRQTAAELAARVRSLIGRSDQAGLRIAASSLGVEAGDLREIVRYETPYPSVAVLAALVAAYGVDAGWLLTGEYSPAMHRADEEVGRPPKARVTDVLQEGAPLAGEREPPLA